MSHTKLKNSNNETLKAGCVIVNDNMEVLLINDTGPEIFTPEGRIWAFPKGHAEEGETFEQVALREVKEETGYDIEIVGRLSDLTYTHSKTGELIRVTMFRAKLLNPGKATEIEIESHWFPLEEAKKVIYPNLAFLLDEIS